MKTILLNFLILYSSTLLSQWQMLDGPYETQAVQILSKHPNGTLFAYGEDSNYQNRAIYRSTDSGNSWFKVSNDIIMDKIFGFDFDSQGGIYAGSRYRYYYSLNNGDTWQIRNTTTIFGYVASVNFNSEGNIFLGTSSGIYTSTNNGVNWINKLNVPTYDLLMIDSSNSFAATSSGIYFSSDNGYNWSLRSTGLPLIYYHTIAQNSSGDLFAHTLSSGLYKSTDNGLNWSPTNFGSTFTWELKIDQNDYLYLSSAYNGVYKSTDDGSTWQLIPLESVVYTSLVDNQNNFYAGNSKGLYKYSEIDSAWHLGKIYKELGYIRSFTFCSNNIIYASTSMRLWKSTDLGLTWNNINDQTTSVVIKGKNNRTFISSPLLFSDNCTENWYSSNLNSLDKIYISSDSNLYGGSRLNVYKSSDNGESWNLIGTSNIYGVQKLMI